MKKYFFDRVNQQHAQYDYCGRDLPTLERAVQMAELIALDLGMDDEGWTGWTVNVRGVEGFQYCAVPVTSMDRVAA